MIREPLISIIVPIYNVESYIEECIESIQKQTYHNLQIILVDDGSDDRSGSLCDRYAVDDSRINVIHKENGGLVGARKAGLSIAKGTYIGFVDGDDYIDSNMYQRLVEELQKSGADFVHSGYWIDNSKRIPSERKVIDLSDERAALLEDVLLEGTEYNVSYSIWSKLFREELIKKSYDEVPDDCSNGEDLINLCVCILESNKIVLSDDAFYHYRIRNDSISHRKDIDSLKEMIRLYNGLNNALILYGYHETSAINKFLWRILFKCMGRISHSDFRIALYYYDGIDKLQRKRVVIYGAGMVGKDYYAQISRYGECEIVAWVDAKPEKYHYPHVHVNGIDVLDKVDFDILLIAIENESTVNAIYSQLNKRGITLNKIYWSKPCVYDWESMGE